MKRLLLTACAFASLAAAADPVEWKLADGPARTVKPGGHFTVALNARIQPGWHMYSLKPVPNGPIPTRIWIGEGQPFALAGAVRAPAATEVQDPSFNMEVETYESDVSFTLPVRVPQTTTPGTQVLLVNVSYQSCDSRVCLPPKTVKVSLPLEIAR
jgi:DsbC/DsbD-like thiol-disulfide interchange protein